MGIERWHASKVAMGRMKNELLEEEGTENCHTSEGNIGPLINAGLTFHSMPLGELFRVLLD